MRVTTAVESAEGPNWRPDPLPGFEQRSIALAGSLIPGESELRATLVRRTLAADPGRDARPRAVLSFPGMNDAFYHPHVADFFERQGFTFYALDPRRSGRSLTDPRFRDFVTDLSEVYEELDAAHDEIASRHESVVVWAHSTGGLAASLWASDRPGRLAGLALNSPWLGLWGTSVYAPVIHGAMTVLSRRDPLQLIPLPDPGDRYAICAGVDPFAALGFDPGLTTPGAIPIRAGWLRAVLRGQRRLAKGLNIDAPVFVACSSRSYVRAAGFSQRARTSDVVLDVE